MALEQYVKKRDFSKTNEPKAGSTVSNSQHRWVVQEHHASHLHYDFRLEMDGVLKSWAVPKGPPPEPGIRRLAVMTEDHPVEYLAFAGTIPEGNYGAGEMSIWDTGTFESVADANPVDGVHRGKLELLLHGKKLDGKYDLIRTDDEKNNWIFIKTKVQTTNAAATNGHMPASRRAKKIVVPKAAQTAEMPDAASVEPMLAVTLDEPFDDPSWQFEIKWDGYRALCTLRDGTPSIFSRNHQPLLSKVPELSDLQSSFNCRNAIIDGEIVALDDKGLANFQALQDRFGFGVRRAKPQRSKTSDDGLGKVQLIYMVFDILYYEGYDLTAMPLSERRALLKAIVSPGGHVRVSDEVIGTGKALFSQLESIGVEGMMAKKIDSPYRQRRSESWAKIKVNQTLDVVIGGYTESPAERRPFAALVVGQWEGTELVPLGHIGTGFDAKSMEQLLAQFKPLISDQCPFTPTPVVNGVVHWLTPSIVCEVKYSTVTNDHQLRHPVFLHLRPDKSAKDCKVDETNYAAQSPPSESDINKKSVSPVARLAEPSSELVSGSTAENATLKFDDKTVSLTHLSKVYWPQTGTTKRDLIRYYETVSPALLPYLRDRPIVVERYPDGVGRPGFFQHDMGEARRSGKAGSKQTNPEFLRLYTVEESNGDVDYAICDDLPSLLYLANLGTVPIHCWNITTSKPHFPDRIVFDFDPPAGIADAVDATLTLKSLLDEIGLTSYPKTSGANGIHVYVPIVAQYETEFVVALSKLIGKILVSKAPDLVTTERRIKSRGEKKVYVDCVQNAVGKTVVAPYSVRACETPTVSTPLEWGELQSTLDLGAFTIDTMPARLADRGDIFSHVLQQPQELESAIGKLAERYAGVVKAVPGSVSILSEAKQVEQREGSEK
jgi:bifunctional non-homologous end joining protein LigD